jgi:hypothetical protein
MSALPLRVSTIHTTSIGRFVPSTNLWTTFRVSKSRIWIFFVGDGPSARDLPSGEDALIDQFHRSRICTPAFDIDWLTQELLDSCLSGVVARGM